MDLTVRFPDDMEVILERASLRKGLSKAGFVRMVTMEYLEKHPTPPMEAPTEARGN